MDLACILVVKNEIDTVPHAIRSVQGVCRQIVVVDTGSSDGTPDMLRSRFGIDPVTFVPPPHTPFKTIDGRNMALSKVTCRWVLTLDADEVLMPEAAAVLAALPDEQEVAGFFGRWRNVRHGIPYDDYKLLVFRGDVGIRFLGLVHEVPQTSIRSLGLKAAWLPGLDVDHRQRPDRPHRPVYAETMRRGIAEQPEWIRYHWFLGYSLQDNGHAVDGEVLLETAARSLSKQFPVESLNASLVLAGIKGRRGDDVGAAEAIGRMRAFLAEVGDDFEVAINDYDAWLDAAEDALRRGVPEAIPTRIFAY